MISKEQETFSQIARLLETEGSVDRLLMENLFYSITPIIMRTMIDPEWFRNLFWRVESLIQGERLAKEKYALEVYRESDTLYLIIQGESYAIKESIQKIVKELQIPPSDFVASHIWMHEVSLVGIICRMDDLRKQQSFLRHVEEEVERANIRLMSGRREKVTDDLRSKILFKSAHQHTRWT